MNVERRFRRLVFAQVLLGIVAFCIAERNVGLMLIAGSLTVLSRYVTEGPKRWTLPRWVMNALALVAMVWLVNELLVRRSDMIIAMGHFTMCLQVLLLYTPRTNRDHAWVLVLSFMLMTGASILSVSMIYGALLLVYCVLGLWTVLWFQFKWTADEVRDAARAAGEDPAGDSSPPIPDRHPVTGLRYRWHLRAVTWGVVLVCGVTSLVVFVTLPRAQSNYFAQRLRPAGATTVGFANQVDLNTTPLAEGDNEPVLNMRVWRNGREVSRDNASFLLRGAVLDYYDPQTHRWRRREAELTSRRLFLPAEGRELATTDDPTAATYEARIILRNTTQSELFTVHPVTWIDGENLRSISYSPVDQQMSASAARAGGLSYSLRWPSVTAVHYLDRNDRPRPFARTGPPGYHPVLYARQWTVQRQRIAALVESVIAARDLKRDPTAQHTPQDQAIVDALRWHLRTNYRYTLAHPAPRRDGEPLIDFLFNHKSGHCELFASALAAMCRSINIPARVITGYRVSEYNGFGGYYVVREDDAHAWCEVDLGPDHGWVTVDPTPPVEVAAEHSVGAGWTRTVSDLYDYAEFHWLRTVVAYDPRARTELLTAVGQWTRETFGSSDNWIGRTVGFIGDLPRIWRLDRLNYTLAGVILVFIGIALISLVRTLVVRRYRLAALQLTALPPDRRRGLSRKLRFYLHMLELLERHGLHRPPWQSPRRFAENLAALNPAARDPAVQLTDSFYAVRFGRREPDEQAIRRNMHRLERALAGRA